MNVNQACDVFLKKVEAKRIKNKKVQQDNQSWGEEEAQLGNNDLST